MLATRLLASACAVFALSATAFCSTVTVTSPAGLSTSNGTPAYNTWYADDMRSGASAGITNAHADYGTGSLQFVSPNDMSAKADYAYYFSTPIPIGNLTSLSYDFYRSSASSANANLDPALRIYVTNGTVKGSIVYEPIYNSPAADQTSPMDQFVFADAIDGKLWATGTLAATSTSFLQTFAQWEAAAPGLMITEITTGIGSGTAGTFDGAVDNITYGVNGANTTFNFESAAAVNPTPEPSSIFLLGTGILSVGGAAMRRRKLAKV